MWSGVWGYAMGHEGTAGVVLVGGRSSRMGTPKAALEWHGSTLLRRTLGVLARSVDGPLLVVRAAGQPLPGMPQRVDVVEDPEEGLGPLQGIAAGLAALAGRARAAFVCSTDLPFLHPAFVHRVLMALTDDLDVVLPVARGYPQPLAAAYRVTLAPLVAELVATGDLRPAFLLRHDRCRTLRLGRAALLADQALAVADPALDSVVNVNSPDDYRAARCRPAPVVTVQRFGALAGDDHRGPRTVRAATLSGAAAAVGLVLDRYVIVALNGDQISCDGDVPLAGGDTVAFSSVRIAPQGAPRLSEP
jgi:molybdenum cofactor guanylyltransferase